MTAKELEELKVGIILTAEYYGRDLKPGVVTMMADDLADLPFDSVDRAFRTYRLDPKNRLMPLPAQIRAIISPQVESREFAIELAWKIKRAIGRHGWAWDQGCFGSKGLYWEGSEGQKFESFKEALISELGEIGWHVVCQRGSFEDLRNSANELDEGVFIAQLREQIQASFNLQRLGVDVAQIEMPKRKAKPGLEKLGVPQLENAKHNAEKSSKIGLQLLARSGPVR